MTKTPIFQLAQALERLQRTPHEKAVNFYAMYSSILGGIVTDPGLMVLPLDDHMVHRGHAVFDTATLTDGMLYQLDPHLDRLLRSAQMARIKLPAPRERLLGHFFRALDELAPHAERVGTQLYVENMPFAFLPYADGLMAALEGYGDDRIAVIYDVANAIFIGEDPGEGLRRVQNRLKLVHLSDTPREVYRHSAVGEGVVPFAAIPPVLDEVGYADLPMLEIIAPDPDQAIRASIERLEALGWPRASGDA
jgi:hypothetical protein